MFRKELLFLFLWAQSLLLSAQHNLISEGEVFAHDVNRTVAMPPALHQLIGHRTVLEQQSIRGHYAPARFQRNHKNLRTAVRVGPLLKSIRNQNEPYNWLCPQWKDADGNLSEKHCLTGCVATAIEQVMAYYRYPELLLDTLHGWANENYSLEDLLPGTRFDWGNYLHDYRDGYSQEQGMAIALPSLAAGMAVHMNYGLDSSGANVYRAVGPLQQAFGYGMVDFRDRIFYTPEKWHLLLQHELQQGRPIVYVGHNMELDGHAFNIDGVDESGYYHVNWGYNGCYDGWYDLDWLNPWNPEDYDDNTFPMGFFCNHGALFMHPSSDSHILELDTLEFSDIAVELKEVQFLRNPDTKGFIGADFYFKNQGNEKVTYTYEVMSYLPTDTAIFQQADYVALAGLTLAPQEERRQRVYMRFTEPGNRILGISHDDETIPFTMPVNVENGTSPQVEWGDISVSLEEIAATSDVPCSYQATFSIPAFNHAESGYSGDLITYCLYTDGKDKEDDRHYEVLSLAGGQQQTLQVVFRGVKPGKHYTFLLRQPWTIRKRFEFDTPQPVGIDEVRMSGREKDLNLAAPRMYDLSGRKATSATRGVLIQEGFKRRKRRD